MVAVVVVLAIFGLVFFLMAISLFFKNSEETKAP